MSFRYDVFLSHSTADKPFVERLAVRLEEQGLRPFLDKWHLTPGDPFQEALERALDESATCAVFVGPSGLTPWQNLEMRSALDERMRRHTMRVIPLLLPGADPHDPATVPRFLRLMLWIAFGSVDDDEAFRRLVAGIRGDKPGRDGSPPPHLTETLIRGDSEERREAAIRIAASRASGALELLGERYPEEIDPTVRHWLALAVGTIGGDDAIVLLRHFRGGENDGFAIMGIDEALEYAEEELPATSKRSTQ